MEKKLRSIYLPMDLIAKIQAIADDQDRSFNYITHRILRKEMETVVVKESLRRKEAL